MYVDKKLGGVNAVHTLSRLNRTHAHGWKSKYRISQFRISQQCCRTITVFRWKTRMMNIRKFVDGGPTARAGVLL